MFKTYHSLCLKAVSVLFAEILNEKNKQTNNILIVYLVPCWNSIDITDFPQTVIYCGFWQEKLKINRKLRGLSLKIFNFWIKDL